MASAADIVAQLRWQDVADVAILTFVLYRIYTWLRGTAGLQILLTMAALAALAYGASALGLMLTAYVLQALGAIAALVMVVVFRDEIRRGLRRIDPLRVLRRRRAGRPDDGGRCYAILADAACALAARRIGALVVVPRADRIEEHLTGGTRLDAEPSRALFEALFHTTSPLHDGAVVMDERVRVAGAFLPLTGRTDVADHLGTRHRAALGLSERCDAVVLAVSEERGELSLIEGGAIASAPADPDALAARLVALVGGRARPPRRGRATDLVALATILALVVGAWSTVLGGPGQVVVRTVEVELQGLPESLELESMRPTQVRVHLRGPRALVAELGAGDVAAWLNVAGATAGGRRVPVTTEVPTGVDVVEVAPPTVTVRLRRAAP